jgi:hypothetical protein
MGGNNMNENRTFITCEKCGKKLIERKSNGLWYFLFGKRFDKDGIEGPPPVEIYVQGSLRMRCLRRTCGHWNYLHYFPSFMPEEVISGEDSHSISPC